MKWLSETYFRLTGWEIVGSAPDEPKFVAIGYPHTSNWDFFVYLAVIGHFGLKMRFLMHEGLFVGPLGWLFRQWGGIPVQGGTKAIVGTLVAAFNEADVLRLAVAPEGRGPGDPDGRLDSGGSQTAPMSPWRWRLWTATQNRWGLGRRSRSTAISKGGWHRRKPSTPTNRDSSRRIGDRSSSTAESPERASPEESDDKGGEMRLNQVTVPCTDVADSVGFYTRLGLERIVASDHYARFVCPDGDTTLSVHEVDEVAEGAAPVVYFECDDLDLTVRELEAAGVVFDSQPTDQRWLCAKPDSVTRPAMRCASTTQARTGSTHRGVSCRPSSRKTQGSTMCARTIAPGWGRNGFSCTSRKTASPVWAHR